jgi:hypothetical protein
MAGRCCRATPVECQSLFIGVPSPQTAGSLEQAWGSQPSQAKVMPHFGGVPQVLGAGGVANLSAEKLRQKGQKGQNDRTKLKPLKPQLDSPRSVDLSICLICLTLPPRQVSTTPKLCQFQIHLQGMLLRGRSGRRRRRPADPALGVGHEQTCIRVCLISVFLVTNEGAASSPRRPKDLASSARRSVSPLGRWTDGSPVKRISRRARRYPLGQCARARTPYSRLGVVT